LQITQWDKQGFYWSGRNLNKGGKGAVDLSSVYEINDEISYNNYEN